jgi:2'-5' RNA ligase
MECHFDRVMSESAPPLILTLQMEEDAYALFDALRRRHFPEALNHIPAHVTLFHALPGEREAGITEAIDAKARGARAMGVTVTGLRFMGKGVAFALESEELSAFRGQLASAFAPWLTSQDRQGWHPHVTVQNKVEPETARTLLTDLQRDFTPFRFMASGVLLWRYLGGPWEPRAALLFGGSR